MKIELEKLTELKQYDTKLDSQIVFMETMDSIIKTPLVTSILTSLKELKGIKQNQIENLKNKIK